MIRLWLDARIKKHMYIDLLGIVAATVFWSQTDIPFLCSE